MQLSNEPLLKGYSVSLEEVHDEKIRFFQEIRLKIDQEYQEKQEEESKVEESEGDDFEHPKMLSESFHLNQQEGLISDTESIAASECVHGRISAEKQLTYERFQGLIRGTALEQKKKAKEIKNFQ